MVRGFETCRCKVFTGTVQPKSQGRESLLRRSTVAREDGPTIGVLRQVSPATRDSVTPYVGSISLRTQSRVWMSLMTATSGQSRGTSLEAHCLYCSSSAVDSSSRINNSESLSESFTKRCPISCLLTAPQPITSQQHSLSDRRSAYQTQNQ